MRSPRNFVRNNEQLTEQFKKWEFNVYDVADASKQRPLTYVLYELLKKYDLLTTFKVRFLYRTRSW